MKYKQNLCKLNFYKLVKGRAHFYHILLGLICLQHILFFKKYLSPYSASDDQSRKGICELI